MDGLLEQHIKKIVDPNWAPNNKIASDSYQSLDFPFEPVAVPHITLENHWDLNQYLNYLYTWSGTRRCMEAIGTGLFEDAQNALQNQWGDSSRTHLVRHPLTIIAGAAWS